MTAEIKKFTGNTTLDLEPDDVLEAAKGKLEDVMLIGWTPEGDLYLASTTSRTGDMFLLLEMAKSGLIDKIQYGDET
jgi:hypothetical protein